MIAKGYSQSSSSALAVHTAETQRSTRRQCFSCVISQRMPWRLDMACAAACERQRLLIRAAKLGPMQVYLSRSSCILGQRSARGAAGDACPWNLVVVPRPVPRVPSAVPPVGFRVLAEVPGGGTRSVRSGHRT
eukprot:286700-Rhodomonas_salina.2